MEAIWVAPGGGVSVAGADVLDGREILGDKVGEIVNACAERGVHHLMIATVINPITTRTPTLKITQLTGNRRPNRLSCEMEIGFPHVSQNLASSEFLEPQYVQYMVDLLLYRPLIFLGSCSSHQAYCLASFEIAAVTSAS